MMKNRKAYVEKLKSLGLTESKAEKFIDDIVLGVFEDSMTIVVNYTDGDSFGVEEQEETLECIWTDIDIVKENIKALEEHNDYYRKFTSYRITSEERERLREDRKTKWWYSGKESDADYCIKLKLDNGNLIQLSASWIGYFSSYAEFSVKFLNPSKNE